MLIPHIGVEGDNEKYIFLNNSAHLAAFDKPVGAFERKYDQESAQYIFITCWDAALRRKLRVNFWEKSPYILPTLTTLLLRKRHVRSAPPLLVECSQLCRDTRKTLIFFTVSFFLGNQTKKKAILAWSNR